ncbi:beta 1-4 rhamnosyltransferase Cps2T [Enterocloster bolteae]|uniref:beta 1-4 rhamnosyltransferase Cps2T n=1 Tax=Enterocloster bolteae TaxID=208479 RepID=UPI0028DB6923|nr:DUF1972 domain-containing protein [Enterocloster bolteae]
MQHVFIIGSKGIPGNYGGYETFVDKLTEYHQHDSEIKYHVACKGTKNGEFEYHNAQCFQLKVPEIGSAQAIYYDVIALEQCCRYIEQHHIENPIIYILACRIGPFVGCFLKKIHKFGGQLFVNPDGHEWMRQKWSAIVRKYWKISEQLMTKHADLLICDSKNIEHYIRKNYERYQPKTTYIAYGAETRQSKIEDQAPELLNWYKKYDLSVNNYYLVVGRFVPENNYETMIREFMSSASKHDLALITNVNHKYLEELKSKTKFDQDPRIKFVGTVYNQELLKKIRGNAYAYLHGHEVGGTNPSLLEALAITKINLLLDVGFNRECAEDGALYWNKEIKNLAHLINKADKLSDEEINIFSKRAKKRICDAYSWEFIANEYKKVFISN